METSTVPASELDIPYSLTDDMIRRFREDGFIRLESVLSPALLAEYIPSINERVDANNRLKDIPLEERSLYDKAFVQVGNLWTQCERVRELAFSKRLARIATQLMDTRGVRLWHDQALYKEPSGGFTPWHADQQYWPMASSLCVTAWIPLQPVPLEMGPLAFGRGSHRKRIGRELEISAESEKKIGEAIRELKVDEVQEPYALGDVSYHLGWTLHRAGPNTTKTPRRVFTIIYMDSDMRLAAPANKNQQTDWEEISPDTQIGEIISGRLTPMLYEEELS
jgi:ectoine hydroxylase-related dioxygenase (phytanoyl-CoA dioxygenase family)